jgi:hypothetical protein
MANVFISWSGEKSRQIAEAFKDSLSSMLQGVTIYFTPADLEKGAQWFTEAAKELEKANLGLIFVTKDNLSSTWLHFEAGALSKNVARARVCPVLFGVAASEIKGPLAQFQCTSFNEKEIRQLLGMINSRQSKGLLVQDATLDRTFSKFWPDLQNWVAKILASSTDIPAKATVPRTDKDLLQETLAAVRAMSRTTSESYNRIEEMKHLLQPKLQLLERREQLTSVYQKLLLEGRRIQIIALTGERVIQNCGDIIKSKMLSETCEVQLLILKPMSDMWKYRIQHEPNHRTSADRLLAIQRKNEKWFLDLARSLEGEEVRGSLQCRYFDTIPYFSFCRVDSKIIIGFLNCLHEGERTHAFLTENEGEDFFQDFADHFTVLWNSNENRELVVISERGIQCRAGVFGEKPSKKNGRRR